MERQSGIFAVEGCVCLQGDRSVKYVHHDRWKFVYYGNPPYGEFYDLENDPSEFHNLHNDPGYRKIVKEPQVPLLDELIHTEGEWPVAGLYA